MITYQNVGTKKLIRLLLHHDHKTRYTLQGRALEPAAPKITICLTIPVMEANATKMCLRVAPGSLFGRLSEQDDSMARVPASSSVSFTAAQYCARLLTPADKTKNMRVTAEQGTKSVDTGGKMNARWRFCPVGTIE